MADHGLTGTHHIDGSPCYGQQDEQGNVVHDCTWSATDFMAGLSKTRVRDDLASLVGLMNPNTGKKGFVEGRVKEDDPFYRPKGTTVLSCGCGIPWETAHGRGTKSKKAQSSVVVCETHGITAISDFR